MGEWIIRLELEFKVYVFYFIEFFKGFVLFFVIRLLGFCIKGVISYVVLRIYFLRIGIIFFLLVIY